MSRSNTHGERLEIGPNSNTSDAPTVPTTLISLETLHYVGFSDYYANDIWSRRTNWPATDFPREVDPDRGGLQVSFIDFMMKHFDTRHDAYADDDNKWYRCLGACGMHFSFQAAVMDPAFKDLRLTESCLYWVKDTIKMRYASIPSRHQQATPTQQQQAMPGVSPVPWTPSLATEDLNSVLVFLYKGVDQARVAGLFDDRGELQRLGKLMSMPPTDLSGNSGRFYFHRDYQVAEYYAAYTKRRAACEAVAMIRLIIPRRVFDEMRESDDLQGLFWPEPECKEYIWRSKLNKSLPVPLRKYRDAFVVIAHIAKGAARVFEEMETWEDVAESCFLTVGRSEADPAVHYAFSGRDESQEFLEEHGKFDAFTFSDADLQRVRAREAGRAERLGI